MSGRIYESPNCGTKRNYVFRPLKSRTLKFRVRAPHNVNICLSSIASELPNQFEIFLGGWGGKESAIRRNMEGAVTKVPTPNLLSSSIFKGFWVVITNHAIKVGREGESIPFLNFSDPHTNIIANFYGYCTAYGASGSWTFSDDDPTSFNPDMNDMLDALNRPPLIPRPPQITNPPQVVYPTLPGGATSQTKMPLSWEHCRHGSVCAAPVRAGNGAQSPMVAAARHNGGLIPGLLMPGSNACQIPWGGQSIAVHDYYMLSNPVNADLVWQSARGGNVPMGALQGGYSETGEKLYIGRYKANGTMLCGKVHPSHKVCYVPYWGMEQSNGNYEVLCLKTIPLGFLGVH